MEGQCRIEVVLGNTSLGSRTAVLVRWVEVGCQPIYPGHAGGCLHLSILVEWGSLWVLVACEFCTGCKIYRTVTSGFCGGDFQCIGWRLCRGLVCGRKAIDEFLARWWRRSSVHPLVIGA